MPIVNIEGLGRIEFPDTMSPEEIDRAIKTEILPMVAQRVPAATVADLSPSPAAGVNPFSKGTAKADTRYKAGDRYRYRIVDLLTGIESSEFRGGMVKQVTDSEVIYGNGRITDLLGNMVRGANGRTFIGNQIFVGEYSIGRRWTTVYRGTRRDDVEDEWALDFKVTAREMVTVPAGTFDAFKVEGNGFITGKGARIQIKYWIAPDKVRPYVAYEHTVSGGQRRGANLKVTERTELMMFRQS